MKKTTLLILSFLLFTFCRLYSQIYFISDRAQIGYLNTTDCSITNFTTPGSIAIPTFPDRYTDIAIHPDGRLFGFTVENEPQISYLVDIHSLSRIKKYTLLTLGETDDNEDTALTISPDGEFFFGRTLFRSFDPVTGRIRERGGIGATGIFQGDLAFWNQKLYGGTIYGIVGTRRVSISEIDVFDARFSNVVYETEVDSICLSAMAPFYDETTEQMELMVSTSCRAGNDNRRNYFKTLNLEDSMLVDYCDFNFPLSTSRGLNRAVPLGMSSEDEFRTNFELRLDLDKDNSRGRLIDHFTIDSLCTVKFPIGDNDVWVQSTNDLVDSIQITVAEGILSLGEEVIIAPTDSNFTIKGQGSSRLTAINTGQVSDEQVAEFIEAVLFEITADDPQSGDREIQTLLFANGQVSDTARSFIPVKVDETLFAGEDTSVDICDGKFLRLFPEIENARPGGRWEPSLSGGEGRFSPFEDKPGLFRYIVSEGGCQPDTANVTVNVSKAPPLDIFRESDLSEFGFFCIGDTLQWDISDEIGDLEYAWNDDREGPIQEITETGNYILVVFDPSVNCTFNYEFLAAFSNESTSGGETLEVCFGETVSWRSSQYTIFQDTTLCETRTNADGCSSTECLELIVSRGSPAPQNVFLCEGDSYEFYGRDLTETGTYIQEFETANRCDSNITLNLQSFPTYSFQIDTTISEGEIVNLIGVDFTSGGTFNVRFQTVAGCDSTYQINIDVVSSVDELGGERTVWAANSLKVGQAGYQLRSDLTSEVLIKRMVIVDVLGRQHFQIEDQRLDAVETTCQPQTPGAYWCFAELSVKGKDHVFNQKIMVTN
ncbi:MAG: hypothetical protein AAF705_01870 [Bacteroidota bacterium]